MADAARVPTQVQDSFKNSLKNLPLGADVTCVTEIEASMRQLIDHVVDRVPGAVGALVSSTDGFVLASRLPASERADPPAVAAMSAAALGLADRMVKVTGDAPAASSHHRSDDGQVFVFAIAGVAVLTVLTDDSAEPEQIVLIGRELTGGLERLFRGTTAEV